MSRNKIPAVFLRAAMLSLLLLVSVLFIRATEVIKHSSVVAPFMQDNPRELFLKATQHQDNQSPDSALIYYSWLAETYRNSKDPSTRELVGLALSEMGQIYYIDYPNYMSAYRCLAEAETIFRDSDDREGYAEVLLNLGNLFNIHDYIFPSDVDKDEARGKRYYDLCIGEGIDSRHWSIVCSAYINSVMMDLPFSVDPSLNRRMEQLLEDSIPRSLVDYRLTELLCAGTGAILNGTPGQAREIFRCMRDSIGLTAPRDRYMADLCLSAVAVSEGDYENAIECISRILEAPSDRNDADVYMEVYDLLSKYYARIGRNDKADEYRIRFFETKDSITKQLVELEPTRIGLELEHVRDYARKINAERKQTVIWVISLVIVVVLLIGIAIVILIKNRQLTLKNRVIFDQTRSLLAGNSLEIADKRTVDESHPEKYRDSSLTDETRRQLIERIDTVMSDIDEICDKGFSLQRLTTLVNSNTSYISRIINEKYSMTFGSLLNKLRIREACRRMEDTERYGNLTIDAISESVGFNTRSTFTKAFRLHMGMLPSEYLKLLRSHS